MAKVTSKRTYTTVVEHVAEEKVTLLDLRRFVEACAGLPDDLVVQLVEHEESGDWEFVARRQIEQDLRLAAKLLSPSGHVYRDGELVPPALRDE